jgi:hypothetical protein
MPLSDLLCRDAAALIVLSCSAVSCRATRDSGPPAASATNTALNPALAPSAPSASAGEGSRVAAEGLPAPGQYLPGLHVDVDASRGVVALHMLEATGESTVGPGPQFVYSFYAMGKREPGRAAIPLRAFWDFDSKPRRRLGGEGKGELHVIGPDRIRVRLSFDPGGGMAVGPEISESIRKEGAVFELDGSFSEPPQPAGVPPIVARMVRVPRAVLRKEPRTTSPATLTVLQDEVVYVQEQRKDWLYIRFTSIDGTRQIEGFMRESDLEPLP